MKRILLQLALILFASLTVYAQGKDNSLKGVPAKERIVTGGGFGLGFGSRQDYIMVAPMIGYKLTERLLAGISVSYRYTNYKSVSPGISSIKLNDYGVNPFARFTVYKGVFIQTEFEYLNYEFPAIPENSRKTFNSIFVGGGFLQPLGGKAVLYVMALYNLSYRQPLLNEFTPYPNPLVIRAGINIGNFSF